MEKFKSEYIDGSLLITPEMCIFYSACAEGIAYMQKYHPNGFTVHEVCSKQVRHVPMPFSCWGYHFLPFSQKDKEEFLEFAKIEESTGFFLSHHIKGCNTISDSKYCENSTNVMDSQDVVDSEDIVGSSDVQTSKCIRDSSNICMSEHCCRSERVVDSVYVVDSKIVSGSYVVESSNEVDNCTFVRGVSQAKNSILCVDGSPVNKIACDAECEAYPYAILNKEVSEAVFKRVHNELEAILRSLQYYVRDDLPNSKHDVSPLVSWSRTLNPVILDIMEILPRMSEDDKRLLYQLTLCPDILREI